MVSLVERTDYLLKINENAKLAAFNNLLLNKKIVQQHNNELYDSDEIYYGILSSLQKGNKGEFEKYYDKKSKSKPNKESPAPFVNDDFLIFSIIAGVAKFSIDKNWIKYIISIRSKNIVTTTFENLISENFYSTSNQPEVVLMFLQLTDQSAIRNDLLNSTLRGINANTQIFSNKNDFQTLCAINAFDLIILLKEARDGSEIQQLKLFNSRFIKRTKVLSWIIQLAFLFALLYGLIRLPFYSPETVKLLDEYGYVFTVFGAIGFTVLGNQLGFIARKSHEATMRLLGYTNSLLKIRE